MHLFIYLMTYLKANPRDLSLTPACPLFAVVLIKKKYVSGGMCWPLLKDQLAQLGAVAFDIDVNLIRIRNKQVNNK